MVVCFRNTSCKQLVTHIEAGERWYTCKRHKYVVLSSRTDVYYQEWGSQSRMKVGGETMMVREREAEWRQRLGFVKAERIEA